MSQPNSPIPPQAAQKPATPPVGTQTFTQPTKPNIPTPATKLAEDAPTEQPSSEARRTAYQRIAAIEKRWGKRFEEVLVDIHDHIFGKTPETEPAPSGTKPSASGMKSAAPETAPPPKAP